MVSNKILQDMANVLRRDVLKMTTAAGSGHPTSCMSAAEIMSVLFFEKMKYDKRNAFNPDNDEFVLSKGHAAPILYSSLYRAGCIKNDLMKLRKLGSPLEGHPIPKSLKWIKVATGSLGQGLSVGVGFALAAKLQKRKFKTYVLLGDSEIAEGSVYEAFQLASYYRLNNLVAIIDANRLGQRGETMVGHNIKEYKKRFQGFGWAVKVADGHKIKQIKKALSSPGKGKPLAIIAKTFKGKGVSFLENKEGWHGKALKKDELDKALKELPETKISKIKVRKPKRISYKPKKKTLKHESYDLEQEVATREVYGKTLAQLAKSSSEVIAVDAEVSNSTKSELVKKVNPKQFIETFIGEQNMIGVALGLSKKGFNVFASTFSAFLSRAHDQIRMAALSSGNFTVCGSHSGVSIGEDGASQMGLEDISIFRALPDSVVLYPSDAVSTEKLVHLSSRLKKGISYLRTTRSETPVIYKNNENFSLGDFKVIKQSRKDRAVLVGAGVTLHEAMKARDELRKKGKDVAVVDIYSIKPFNAKKFESFVRRHGNKIVIAEDHRPEGGIGEMLAENLENSGIKIKHLSVKKIPHSGTKEELLRRYGIDWKSIVKVAGSF